MNEWRKTRPCNQGLSHRRFSFSGYEKVLLLLFLLTLPLVNPWVRGDGVGYYAFVRSVVVEHSLNFERDWEQGNLSFIEGRLDPSGHILPNQYTATRHLNNHFSVGSAILWAPFILTVHGLVILLDQFGMNIPPDGLSKPYRMTMAVTTATYSFIGLLLAFRLARQYFEERWAFLATVGIWFGSSLAVYMYFNPSWSHGHSAFIVALFVWYWCRTRVKMSSRRWIILGLISGLMVDVYPPNAILILLPAIDGMRDYLHRGRASTRKGIDWTLLAQHILFLIASIIALMPTFIAKKIIFGHPLNFGYTEHWYWTSPMLGSVLFSANHGLFSWTPILIVSSFGLLLFWRQERIVGGSFLIAALVFYYFISSYQNWAGLSAFGNRFFISLTIFFIVGLTASLQHFCDLFPKPHIAHRFSTLIIGTFIVWNIAFMFQWGTHMIPARGPIVWRKMIYNQIAVVPAKFATTVDFYIFHRRQMMHNIEEQDLEQLKSQGPAGSFR